MATNQSAVCVSHVAGADLSADQYKIVELGASGVTVCNTAGEQGYGVLQNNPTSGSAAEVAIGGIAKVKLGATLAAGAKFTTSNAGLAVAPTAGQFVLGQIVEGGASGEIGSAKLDANGASA